MVAIMNAEADLSRSTTHSVGHVSDLRVGGMKMVRAGDHRLVLVRTESGIHALDNACPHQGYGLATGELKGELLTCQWHNWKFCVADGTAIIGEESVACHPVDVVDDEILVEITTPSMSEQQSSLWPSLEGAIGNDYRGQMARDTARLLVAGADPTDLVWTGIRIGAPKTDYGVGHEMASAADCLSAVDMFGGLDRTLPVVQALAGISETTRGRSRNDPANADATVDFSAALEAEDVDGAVAALRGALAGGADMPTVRRWFIEAVAAHHLSFGHGAIYVQKAFELLERGGWQRADELLPHLTRSLAHGTREDTLPYMVKAMREINDVDIDALAAVPDRPSGRQSTAGLELREILLTSTEAPVAYAVANAPAVGGVSGILDAVSLAVSIRLLRYDPVNEFDPHSDFGWLDISHGLTYARAARWAWSHNPSPAAARLALLTVFMCHDTGRLERRVGVSPEPPPGSADGDLVTAIRERRAADAVAIAEKGEIDRIGRTLRMVSLTDAAGSFIVSAHLIKMAAASLEEAVATGSKLPLMATARLAASPRRERFVERAAVEATRFVRDGTPPTR